jgi:hypothetical protein
MAVMASQLRIFTDFLIFVFPLAMWPGSDVCRWFRWWFDCLAVSRMAGGGAVAGKDRNYVPADAISS